MKVETRGFVEEVTGEGSSVLSSALAAGRMITGTLKSTIEQQAPSTARDAHRRIASAACLGAYGGMAVWALNRLTVDNEAAGEAALALAGVSLGLISEP